MIMYAMRDNISGVYHQPFITINNSSAMYYFCEALNWLEIDARENEKELDNLRYSKDLYRIGKFDENNGRLCAEEPELLLTGANAGALIDRAREEESDEVSEGV